jgi:hypothetical protein
MKLCLIIISLLAICFSALAQSVVSGGESEHYQGVGGDFGKAMLNTFKAQNPQPAEENVRNDLWSWGTAPKGKKMANGKLVDAASVSSQVNWSANWMGDMTSLTPIYLNGSSPYGYYGKTTNGNYNPSPLTPMALSDDPWILAQQLEQPVMISQSEYPAYFT